MNEQEKINKMINAFKTKTIDSALESFSTEQNDEITNKVREYLDSLSEEELLNIKHYLESLLNYCYEGKLLDEEVNEEDKNKIEKLNENELFLLKESIIYFYGRLKLPIDISILKKIYDIDDNKYIKLNTTFSSLQTFNEDLELDFVNKVLSDEEYDKLVRSWTMAYFKLTPNPYDYKDNEKDDWTPAKKPRINRLKINDNTNPKYKKAMSFRLLDLVVLYLFIRNRKENNLTDEEKQIIRDTNIEYEAYSENKKKKLLELRDLILNYK